MEAIILAGGFGTRLRHVVSEVPKPMAPVCGRPFLQFLLDMIARQGVTHAVLAVGYKREVIQRYFGASYSGMHLEYSVEEEPLLTGGAIIQALSKCKEDGVFILNGDTYFDVRIAALQEFAIKNHAELVLAGRRMTDFDRYGTILTDPDGRIRGFVEKQPCSEGVINGGIYFMHRSFLENTKERRFSFEEQVLRQRVSEGKMYAFLSDGYFIDIGIPEDYQKAQDDFRNE